MDVIFLNSVCPADNCLLLNDRISPFFNRTAFGCPGNILQSKASNTA